MKSNAAESLLNTASGLAPEHLPDDPVALKSLLLALGDSFEQRLQKSAQALEAEFEKRVAERVEKEVSARLKKEIELAIQRVYEQLMLTRRRMFGRKSEAHVGQGSLFDEAEVLIEANPEASETALIPPAAEAQAAPASASAKVQKPRGKRKPLPPELPRVEIIHDVSEAERTCACGTPMVLIGEEVSEQLDIVPMQIRVLRHVRKRYGCPKGDQAPVTAPRPAQILPKSNASNSLLAMLLVAKYVDGLPLARFEFVLARAGIRIPRQTLARWVIAVSSALQPIANLMRDALLSHDLIHMDETVVQVLKEPERSPSSTSYMWVQRGGPPDKTIILFDYAPSRGSAIPERLLADWQGYLAVDGYASYDSVCAQPGVVRVACWAHARRKFVEIDAIAGKSKPKSSRAQEAIALIGKLYGVERKAKADGLDAQQRHALRQAESRPVIEQLRRWLDTHLGSVPDGLGLGKAMRYLDGQWPHLLRYLERGDLPIDNNPVENAIRPFVIGRKNWLFSDTQAGARASALIYSLIETAKANGLEPYLWLSKVLNALPAATTAEHFEALLPWNINAQQLITEIAG